MRRLEVAEQQLAAARSHSIATIERRVTALGRLLDALSQDPTDDDVRYRAHMLAHSIRGTASTHGCEQLGELLETLEDALAGDTWCDWTTGGARWAQVVVAVIASEDAVATTLSHSVRADATILVVSSDSTFIERASATARGRLANVASADNSAAALTVARGAGLDAAIISVEDGREDEAFELAGALRATSGQPRLPLAFAAGDERIATRVRAAHAGASVFVAKPLSGGQLDELVGKMLSANANRRPTLVAVDDDPLFLEQVSRVFRERSISVATTTHPETVLALLERVQPDAMLLDIMMPEVDGLDLCRVLRTSVRWRDLPIIIVSARGDLDHRVEAFEAGCDDFLVKPAVDVELLARVLPRVERQQLLRARAERDPLTGLLRRDPFMIATRARMSEAIRHGRHFALALIDLDRFKLVNDEHGHFAGDRVLATCGRMFDLRLREEDLCCRWGGEEFAVALPGEHAPGAVAVLESLHDRVLGTAFESDSGVAFGISFSAGIASFPADGRTVEDLLRRADQRLLIAKRRGRGRVVAS